MKKSGFYFSLLIIYVLFLAKDFVVLKDNQMDLIESTQKVKEGYYEREYQDLVKVVRNNDKEDIKIVYAKVIKREIDEFYDKIVIDRGSKEGVEEGKVVINEEGVVGVIKRVWKDKSEVYLLTNPNINLSIKVEDTYGIMHAKDKKLWANNLKGNEELKEGSLVYTSGLAGILEGFKIGRVVSVKKDALELEQIIEIEPVVNTQKIKYVGIVLA